MVGSLLLAFAAFFLTIWKGDDFAFLIPVGGVAFIALTFLSLKYPACPNCGTPANIPNFALTTLVLIAFSHPS